MEDQTVLAGKRRRNIAFVCEAERKGASTHVQAWAHWSSLVSPLTPSLLFAASKGILLVEEAARAIHQCHSRVRSRAMHGPVMCPSCPARMGGSSCKGPLHPAPCTSRPRGRPSLCFTCSFRASGLSTAFPFIGIPYPADSSPGPPSPALCPHKTHKCLESRHDSM